MLRTLCCLVIAGCGHSAPVPNNNLGDVQVRMARDGEFPLQRGSSDPFSPEVDATCSPRGTPARDQFAPIVAFAREHLVDKLDRFGLSPSSPVHTRLLAPNQPDPPSQRGIVVTVTPMSERGELEVANWWGEGGHSFQYCLHVLHEGTRSVVAVEELHSLISVREAPREAWLDLLVDGRGDRTQYAAPEVASPQPPRDGSTPAVSECTDAMSVVP